MSRQLKSALSIGQTAIAGPSSRPFLPALPHLPSNTPLPINTNISSIGAQQKRYASFGFLPDWMRGKRSNPDPPLPPPPPPATSSSSSFTPSTSVPSSGTRNTTTPATATTSTTAIGGLFDDVAKDVMKRENQRLFSEHSYKSAHHKISPRKLNDLSRQIAGLPIDEAIVQMEFSDKRAASWIKSTLCLARDHAVDKGIKRGRMVVAQSWVSKGHIAARADIKGRGRTGRKEHRLARIHVLLKEGKTQFEQQEARFKKDLGRVRSAGVVREDGVLRRKEISGWTW